MCCIMQVRVSPFRTDPSQSGLSFTCPPWPHICICVCIKGRGNRQYAQRSKGKFWANLLKVALTVLTIFLPWPWLKVRKYSFPSTPFVLFFLLMDFDSFIPFFKAGYWSSRRWPLFTTIKLVIYRKSEFHNPPNSPFIPNYYVNKAPSI